MKFGSLFSGIGGFDLGFERAGMTPAWQCEIDKDASKVLKNHWPDVPNIGDVRDVRRNTVDPIDVLCGGFPCQDVSIAGKRAGLAGERSGLWFEFARVIDELGPRTVVIENVPGLLSSNEGRDFAVILSGLVQFGYGVCWRVLDAQYFGVPQRRRRVFLVGSLGDGRAAEILFERESMSGNIAPRREAGKDVAYSLRANPSRSGDKGDGGINQTMIAGTLAANAGGLNRPAGQGNEVDFLVSFTPSSHGDYVEGMGTLRPNGGLYVNETDTALTVGTTDLTAVAYKIRGGKEGGGKGYLGSEKTAFSLTGFNDQYLGVRRLTPVECERLQGFPDGWTAGQADTARYRQLGNAVAVPVAEWIGKRIVESA